ncbi:MAG: acetyl-CoA carboxylase biotin carboxyl carrier protein subunit [Bacteroidales bacterium]|nr:acetyl-CoA carboxylase biotin carboxyl carrier protein subunit [Bacteroidales bacterium]MCF8333281.1 acetyl-CoA carboxylase biotin carboxyl carrier protein subunit [Bacteroidales bacterium]
MDYKNVPKDEFVDFVVERFKYKTLLSEKYKARRKYVPTSPDKQLAQLPGTVTDIMVKVGDSVELGDIVMSFEAMKMDNVIMASAQGKVKAIHVNVGDKIVKHQLLIEYERR